MRYLLDTNILSALIHYPDGDLAARVLGYDESDICTSVIVAAELRYGVVKRGSRRLEAQVNILLDPMTVVSVEPPADSVYGRIRADLEALGQPIGNNDLWIASQAIALDLVLVTDNEREFLRIDDLAVENWLR